MDINFLLPVDFSLDIIEIDDHIPSLCAMVSYSYSNNDMNINCRNKFWFLKEDWIFFISQIQKFHVVQDIISIQLTDMSHNFCLAIYKKSGIIFFQIRHYYRDYYTDKSCSLNVFRSPLDLDMLAHVTQTFLDCPITWSIN